MTDSSYPVWLDETHIDPQWIHDKLGLTCRSCTVVDISNQGRKADTPAEGATLKLHLEGDENVSLIIKQVAERGRALSVQLGLAREALFYRDFLDRLPPRSVPKIYYTQGDPATGAKIVVMEDLSGLTVDSAVYFGPGSPHCWNKDVAAQVARAPAAAAEVAETTFRAMAKIHARFWKDQDLLADDKQWLRGQQWVQGKGRDSWEASQGLVRSIWETADKTAIKWDPLLKDTVDKAIRGISWEAQLERLHSNGQWTLVHGDFWPGNVMLVIKDKSIRLLDWEMCGIGSGPQDLGQYILSNMEPATWRACERQLIEAYHQELADAGVDVTFDYCWKEYCVGGLERWLWFLAYFLGQHGMKDWAQYFHDQMAAFMHDHGFTADDITQVRP